MFWKFIQYTIHWDKTQMLKIFPSDKINITKMHFFSFLSSKLITVLLLICNSYTDWSFHLSKTLCGIFHFRFLFVFIRVYIFFHQKALTLWLWNVITLFIIKAMEKPHTGLFPDCWFLSCNKKFKIQWYLLELEPPKTDLETNFLSLANRSFKYVTF